MSGIIYEEPEEEEAEEEEYLEEVDVDDDDDGDDEVGDEEDDDDDEVSDSDDVPGESEQRMLTKLPPRPKSAMSLLEGQRSLLRSATPSPSPDSAPSRKRSIHWNDNAQVLEPRPPPSRQSSTSSSASTSSSRSVGVPSPKRQPPVLAPTSSSATSVTSVSSFRRSLKLLGLQPKEFGLHDPPVHVSAHIGQPQPRRRDPKPTFTTRLRSRSVSMDDLRDAARDGRLTPDMERDGDVYKLISNAVYEEWYFRKGKEAMEKKQREADAEKRRVEELEKKKEELRRKSQEKFEDWLRTKTRQMKEAGKKSSNGRQQAFKVTPEQAEQAYLKWKQEKDEQRNKKSKENLTTIDGRLPSKSTPDDKERRREDAQKAYQIWTQRLREAQKEKTLQMKKKEEKEKAEKERKEKEKQEMSRKSFEHWKAAKEVEQKKAEEKERRKQARLEAKEEERRQQRQYEAQQAFLAWLDEVEEREAQAVKAQNSANTPRAAFSFRPARRHSCSM